MDSRQHRGLQIAATGRLVGTGPTWYVPSQTDDREVYRVDADRDWCSCLDHSETGFRCKHMWAVEYTVKLGIDTEGNEILTRTARVSYSQEWTSYNAAQVAEKPTFMRLLADLCSSVPQPPQTTGRPRLPLSDMAFAATFKVYSRFSEPDAHAGPVPTHHGVQPAPQGGGERLRRGLLGLLHQPVRPVV